MYSSGVTAQNYLRGVQATDATGTATFVSIFPGCYSGRMPHIHFEVYRNVAAASSSANKIKTSQLAFPAAPCNAVYATAGYSARWPALPPSALAATTFSATARPCS